LNRVESIQDRNERNRTFSYDINDNLLTESWGGTAQLTYTYDKVSNLKTSYDATSNTTNTYDYDAIYQLTDKTTGNSRFHYNYDVYGDITQREDWINSTQIATLDYTYNKNHQLRHLKQTGSGVITQDLDFSYDRLSQLTKIDRTSANDPKHLITDYQYTAIGLLADINNYVNTTANIISNYHYEYDAGNRLILTTGTDGNSAVDYGNDNQLKTIDNATRASEAYDFNALGIRSGWSTVTGDSRRVLNDGKYEYIYDDEGNLTQKKELLTGNLTTYEWDYRNRLMKVVSGSQIVEYGYDAEDKRVSKKLNGVTTEKYIYDGTDIALVLNAAGTLVERYLYGDGTDNVLSRERSGTVVWSLGDRQGSVVDLVSENGTILNHFVYDGFGSRTGTTAVDFRYGYTGRELDTETGLYYYRARYYDSKVGRFISEDPIGFNAGDTNLYRYVGNNSTNYTDPTGELAQVAGGAIFGGIFGGLYALANDIESGNFGWNTIGNVARGAAIGAVTGAAVAAGVGIVSGFATAMFGTSLAGAAVNTGFVAASTAYGAYNAGGNFGSGKYLTGALDLAGVTLGATKVFSDVTKNIPQMYGAEMAARRANYAAMYPPDPNPPGYQRQIYQVGDEGGQIVPTTRSLAPATTPPGWTRGSDGALVASPARMLSPDSSIITSSNRMLPAVTRESYASNGQPIYREPNPRLGRGNNFTELPQALLDEIPRFYNQIRDLPRRQRPGSVTVLYDNRLNRFYNHASGAPLPEEVSNLLPVIPEDQLFDLRPQRNCGEYKAFSEALLNGSRPQDLHMYTFQVQGILGNNNSRTIMRMTPCDNCQVSLNSLLVGEGVNIWSWNGRP
jgi:RHS repeat-associated protein